MNAGLKLVAKCMASALLVITMFPALVVFSGLFFYERFSLQLIAVQGGLQLVCVAWICAAGVGLAKLWE